MKKTHEKYESELSIKNPNLKLLNKYSGGHKKVKYICLKCGNENEADASGLLAGHGCPTCGIEKMKLSQRRTNSEFINEMKKTQPTLEILSEYVNSNTRIKVRCIICGNEYTTIASNLLSGYSCRSCYDKNRTRSHEEYVDIMKDKKPNILVLGKYVTNDTRIKVKCKVCGHVWNPLAGAVLNQHGCPICAGVKIMPTSMFKNKMKNINNNIELFGDYLGCKEPMLCKCKKCGNEWYDTPDKMLNFAFKCPICERIKSNMEAYIEDFLISNNIKYETQKKYLGLIGVGGRQLSYDFYLPDFNILIEAQGKQHEKPIKFFGGVKGHKIQKEHDKRKMDYARNHNIRLIEIWYYDIDDINNILDNLLLSRLVI